MRTTKNQQQNRVKAMPVTVRKEIVKSPIVITIDGVDFQGETEWTHIDDIRDFGNGIKINCGSVSFGPTIYPKEYYSALYGALIPKPKKSWVSMLLCRQYPIASC